MRPNLHKDSDARLLTLKNFLFAEGGFCMYMYMCLCAFTEKNLNDFHNTSIPFIYFCQIAFYFRIPQNRISA